jgi:PEP-CTERM motif
VAVKRIACTFVLLALASVPAMAGPAITNVTPADAFVAPAGAAGTYGFAFTLNAAETIDALGVFDVGQDGLSGAATVGIWDAISGSLLASAIIPGGTAGALMDGFRYGAIAPLTLAAAGDGGVYFVASYDPSDPITSFASNQISGQPGSAVLDPNVQSVSQWYASGSGLTLPDQTTGAAGAFLGANFTTDPVAAALPEPASMAILGVGLAGLTSLRRRYSRE